MAAKQGLLSFSSLQKKVETDGICSVLDEFRAARKASPSDEDLRTVGEALQLCQDTLTYDPKQLPSQILGRITSPPKSLEPFLEECRKCSDVYLLPNQALLTAPGGQLVHSLVVHKDEVNGLTMTSDGKYAVTCSSDRTICVVDVTEGKLVRRTEKTGKEPTRLLLCCNDSIIVTDTEKDIEAYKFDTGEAAWKIPTKERAVFCACGSTRDVLVVFSARNMDLYDAKTGQATGSVIQKGLNAVFGGEMHDHCTASSTRYAVVAYGDTTEYILVVDTKDKKVVKQRHLHRSNVDRTAKDFDETDCMFQVMGLAVTVDEKHVIVANVDDNDLLFLDLKTLETEKIYKGKEMDFSEKFHVTPDGLHLYFGNKYEVKVWDLKNARYASCLKHVHHVNDAATSDMRTFVTISGSLVLIWDLHRGLAEGTTPLVFKDTEVIKKYPPNPKKSKTEEDPDVLKMHIRSVTTMPNLRYVLLVSNVRRDYFLQVYDVSTETVVRRAHIGRQLPLEIHHVEGTKFLAEVDRRVKLFDVDKLEVVRSFQGRLPKYAIFSFALLKSGQELVTITKGGKNLKFYDVARGTVSQIVKQTGNKPVTLDSIMVNKGETVLLAGDDDSEKLLVFDLTQRSHVFTINCEDVDQTAIYLIDAKITDDGRYLLYTGELKMNKAEKPTQYGDLKFSLEDEATTQAIFVYDMQMRKTVRHLVDTERFWQYKSDPESDLELGVSSMTLLDHQHLLSSDDDNVLRLFDIHTGQLLKRIENRHCTASVYAPKDSPLVITDEHSENETLKVWRKRDMAPVASFSSDHSINDVAVLGDHTGLFLARTSYSDPVIFRFHGNTNSDLLLGNQKPLSSCPELFVGKNLTKRLVNFTEDVGVDDCGDPDDDVEDVTPPDSDDDSWNFSD